MKKIKMAVVSLCLTLLATIGMVAGTAAPAQAASGGSCLNYSYRLGSDIQTCVNFTWITQPDGNGIILTSMSHSTPRNCGRLEDSGGKYEYRALRVKRDFYWPSVACSGSAGLYEYGDDYGSTDISVWMKARINVTEDYNLGWLLRLYADGRIVVLDKSAQPIGGCC